MIKKLIVIIIFVILLLTSTYFIFFRKDSSKSVNSNISITPINTYVPSDNPSLTKTPNNQNNGDYQLNYIIVRPTDIIELHSNLEEKLTSTEARNKFGCTSLISGGFYGTSDEHLGLFVAQSNLISKSINSTLLNGFFLIDNSKTPTIVSKVSDNINDYRIAIQSGPLLLTNKIKTSAGYDDTDYARRIIVAISNRGEITFLSLHTKNNPLLGPTLNDLPGIIESLGKTTSLNLVDAINLDGGSHSTFLTESANLSELSTIGSFFCIKPR